VTKTGKIAGPRVVEHMVDAVVSFEGDTGHHFRILRAIKNRFGPTDEIGVFEMSDAGLREVPNPSELFLAGRDLATPGTAVFAGMEGTRPLLVEIQALVAPTLARNAAAGRGRVGIRAGSRWLLAVLEAHGGLKLGMHDIYLNIAGGLRVQEPAADLAAAAALVSSLSGAALPLRHGVFRRGRAFGRDPPRRARAGRAEGGAQARLSAAVSPARAQRSAGARPARGTSSIGHIADLVAGDRGHPPARKTGAAAPRRVTAADRRGYTPPPCRPAPPRLASRQATRMPVSILDLVVLGSS
jgi:DNA repair protein RadA/Sms